MKKRTSVDFSKHELKITQLDGVLIHEFKRPDTNMYRLVFINTCGVMTVTGDFGNWVFCREFHPSGDNDSGVSSMYWDGKLQIHSVQESHRFDPERTLELIREFKDSFVDNYGREMDEDEMEWLERLEYNVNDEPEYIYTAYREMPSNMEYEDVPFVKVRHPSLNAVYDGFDAICQLLKQSNNQNV